MQTNAIADRAQSTYTISARPAKTEAPIQAERAAKDGVVISREALAQSKDMQAQKVRKQTVATEPLVREKVVAQPVTKQVKEAPQVKAAPEVQLFGQQDLDAVTKGFGATTGSDNYSAAADADGNGVVNFRDFTHILANSGQTPLILPGHHVFLPQRRG